MTGKPKNVADTKAINELLSSNGEGINMVTTKLRPNQRTDAVFLSTKELSAIIMRLCGCTFREIGEGLGQSRQAAEQLVKQTQSRMKGGDTK